MVIDYSKSYINEDGTRRESPIVVTGDYPSMFYEPYNSMYVLEDVLANGEKRNHICTPCITETKTSVEKESGIKGLLGKTKEVQKSVVVGQMPSILVHSHCNGNVYYLTRNGFDSAKEDNYIALDPKTGMPKIVKQPDSVDKIVALIEVDPRYVSQIDVAHIKSSSDRKMIAEAVKRGVKNVLEYQVSLGVKFDEKESEAREQYVEEVKTQYATYEKAWQSANNQYNSLEEEVQ